MPKITAKQLDHADDGMLFIGDSLYLDVSANGTKKYWRWKYKHDGKTNTASYGTYPKVKLLDAKESHRVAQRLVSQGINYNTWKRLQKRTTISKGSNTFEAIAREWFAATEHEWVVSHSSKIINRMENDIFPVIGDMPVDEIATRDVQGVIERIKSRGAYDTALRAKQNCSQVFKYAAQLGKVSADPAQFAKAGKIARKHYPALTEPASIGRMLRAFDAHMGSYQVKAALLLAPMLFVRPANLRTMEWAEINFESNLWTIPAIKTKRKRDDLVVPLARQAVKVLTELHNYTGYRIYAFPGRDPKKPMSNMKINAAIKSLGFNTATEITGHGFRAMARTILHETLDMNPDWIERQLDHAVSGSLGTAYNRTQFLDKRVTMMQKWANWLDEQKKTVHP